MDVLVVGAGPAGTAVAGACRARGLDTALVDPSPDRAWTATYGMWSAELPADLPDAVVAARATGRAIAVSEHDLGWEYAVLDVPELQRQLTSRLAGVTVYRGRAVGMAGPGLVELADGSELRASVVIDAAGRRRPLDPARSPAVPAEQTAYGVVLDESAVTELVAPGEALFMDWRPDHGDTGWPTFLYAVPVGGGRVLVEETALARRPGLRLPVLQRRLFARLAHHGIDVPESAVSEKVSFPVDQPRHRGHGVLGFGAAAPLIHPATGYSVASSLHLAPRVADALADHLPSGPAHALAAAEASVWPRGARWIHRFRRIGLESLLRMPPEDVPGFFERFFTLPEADRWTYLTGRDDVRGTVGTMGSLFRTSNNRLRRHLVTSALVRPLASNETP